MYGTLISTQTLASTAASVTFSSIPGTYTDLVLVISGRSTSALTVVNGTMNLNGDSGANYNIKYLLGNGSSASSSTFSANTSLSLFQAFPGASATASTFGNLCVTIPNYTASTTKVISIDQVHENNAATAYQAILGETWSGTAAVTSILITSGGSFDVGSMFSLYGVLHA